MMNENNTENKPEEKQGDVTPEKKPQGQPQHATPEKPESTEEPAPEPESKEPASSEPNPEAESKEPASSEPNPEAETNTQSDEPPKKTDAPPNQVLVLQGTDEVLNSKIITVLRECGVQPVFLQDKAHKTKTLHQKSEEFSQIPMLLVILSADNLFYPKNAKPSDALLCAPQEFVFEIGFWIGQFGRDHIFIVYKEKKNFRLPSQFFDAVYCPFDYEGRWISVLEEKLKGLKYRINESWDRHQE